MKNPALYDKIADQYENFVHENLANVNSVLALATQSLLSALGSYTELDVCDLACGEGHLSLHLAEQAQSIVGVDISSRLIELAKAKAEASNISFVVDDAQTLASQEDQSFDRVISNLAVMDIPDLEQVYKAVFRVLRHSGRFVFSLTHPCFQAPNASIQVDDKGEYVARCVTTYANEGFWRSDNPTGIRGQVGAHHRTISTYLNLATKTGFKFVGLTEPTLPPQNYNEAHTVSQIEIPSLMVIVLQK